MTGRLLRGRAVTLAAAIVLAGCSGPAASGQAADPGFNRVGETVFATSNRPAMPALTGPTLSGGTLTLSSLLGHVVVVNVWASWCGPCKAESPALVQVARNTAARGVVFVGIDENDQNGLAQAFLARIGCLYANLADPAGELLAQLRMLPPAVPSSLVIDRHGRVAARVIGPATGAQMASLIQGALSKP